MPKIRSYPDDYEILIRMSPYSGSSRLVASPALPVRLIERMDEVGIGTLRLAEEANVNKETISLWRKGKQASYTYEMVTRVASPLETTAEYLLDLPEAGQGSVVSSPSPRPSAGGRRQDLVRRIAELGPVIEGLSELEDVVAEARKLSEG